MTLQGQAALQPGLRQPGQPLRGRRLPILNRQDAPSWWQAALYGISWGALFYMTGSLVVTYLGLAVFLRFSSRDRRRTTGRLSVAMLLSAIAVTPWTLRNRRELGAWMFMRSNPSRVARAALPDG